MDDGLQIHVEQLDWLADAVEGQIRELARFPSEERVWATKLLVHDLLTVVSHVERALLGKEAV